MFIFLLVCGLVGVWIGGWLIGIRVIAEVLSEVIWVDDFVAENTIASIIALLVLPPFGVLFVLWDTLGELADGTT